MTALVHDNLLGSFRREVEVNLALGGMILAEFLARVGVQGDAGRAQLPAERNFIEEAEIGVAGVDRHHRNPTRHYRPVT